MGNTFVLRAHSIPERALNPGNVFFAPPAASPAALWPQDSHRSQGHAQAQLCLPGTPVARATQGALRLHLPSPLRSTTLPRMFFVRGEGQETSLPGGPGVEQPLAHHTQPGGA
mmetsp:Transcript_12862/g.39257  ORF Transcript_12862/g.39257 Transcript_12862/m.39257 type:complete len:113 (+) Transcript_12862:148-486(+)